MIGWTDIQPKWLTYKQDCFSMISSLLSQYKLNSSNPYDLFYNGKIKPPYFSYWVGKTFRIRDEIIRIACFDR